LGALKDDRLYALQGTDLEFITSGVTTLGSTHLLKGDRLYEVQGTNCEPVTSGVTRMGSRAFLKGDTLYVLRPRASHERVTSGIPGVSGRCFWKGDTLDTFDVRGIHEKVTSGATAIQGELFLKDGNLYRVKGDSDDVLVQRGGRGFPKGTERSLLPREVPEPVLVRSVNGQWAVRVVREQHRVLPREGRERAARRCGVERLERPRRGRVRPAREHESPQRGGVIGDELATVGKHKQRGTSHLKARRPGNADDARGKSAGTACDASRDVADAADVALRRRRGVEMDETGLITCG
jgi:hypothetical protein